MSTRVDPNLFQEIARFGTEDIRKCINCGNCTAVCELSENHTVFPRKTIRYLQLGLKDKLLASPEPWLCYYCGECSDTCPRQANPGETMMALRRWLTVEYDHSGLANRFYSSAKQMWLAIFGRAMIPLVLLVLFHLFTGFRHIVTDRVEINSFAPVMWVWAAVLIHFLFLGYRVFSGAHTMSQHILGPDLKWTNIPWQILAGESKTFLSHFFTQKHWRSCGSKHYRAWGQHFVLVIGYLIMLVLVVGLLGWFQTDNIYSWHHPQRWLGYIATVALLYGSIAMLIGRLHKKQQIHKFSHLSDWLFPGFILVGAVTGILVHIFRYAGLPWPTYILYVIHVMAMVAMLDVEVGVGKWTHLIYRPLATYLIEVRRKVGLAIPDTVDSCAPPA